MAQEPLQDVLGVAASNERREPLAHELGRHALGVAGHATYAEDHPRRTVFAGTVNPGDNGYLRDDENRRFWPIVCGAIDMEGLRAERDQLWAEAVQAFHAGETWYLGNDDVQLARVEQDARRETSNWDEPLRMWLAECGKTEATVDDVFEHMTKTPVDQRKKADRNELGTAFRRLGWEAVKRGGRRVFLLPASSSGEARRSPLTSAAAWLEERDPADTLFR